MTKQSTRSKLETENAILQKDSRRIEKTMKSLVYSTRVKNSPQKIVFGTTVIALSIRYQERSRGEERTDPASNAQERNSHYSQNMKM